METDANSYSKHAVSMSMPKGVAYTVSNMNVQAVRSCDAVTRSNSYPLCIRRYLSRFHLSGGARCRHGGRQRTGWRYLPS